MKKFLQSIAIVLVALLATYSVVQAVTVLTVPQGGTGITYPSTGFQSGYVLIGQDKNGFATSTALFVDTTNKRVGISTTSPGSLLSIAGSAGAAVPLFMISSSTAAFATSTAFIIDKNGNIGIGSTTPSTVLSVNGTISSPDIGIGSERFGLNSIASGTASIAFGNGAAARGVNAIAIGNNASVPATSRFSLVIGDNTTVTDLGVAIGYNSSTGGSGAGTAVGYFASAAGTGGTALGFFSIAGGDNSFALGRNTTTLTGHFGSVAIGFNTQTTAANQMQIGSSNSTYGVYDAYIGNGATSTTPLGFTLNSTGGAGADVAGTALTIAGGKATGLATPGSILFKTSTIGSTGSTLQTLAERMRVDGLTGFVGIGTTTPTTQFQVTTTTSNATTTITVGKANQTKGSCLELFDSAGTAVYAYVAGGATTFTLSATSCK